MKKIPEIDDLKIKIRIPINFTLRPIQYYINDNNYYYLNMKTKLNGMIIPIIENCK